MIGSIIYFLILLTLTVHPIYQTLEVIKHGTKPLLTHWLVFWYVYSLMIMGKEILSWLPFYNGLELIIIFIVQYPLITTCIKKYFLLTFLKEIKKFYRNFIKSDEYKKLLQYRFFQLVDYYYYYLHQFHNNSTSIIKSFANYIRLS